MQVMKYRVNEIFSSWQGEGIHTGRRATFVRLSGCNLSCSWCDTNYQEFCEMGIDEIVEKCSEAFVVLTGGEPTLQDISPLIAALHKNQREVAIETNGINNIPSSLDWIAIAPKEGFVGLGERLRVADEVKLVITPSTVDSHVEWAIKNACERAVIWLQPEGNKTGCLGKCMEMSQRFNVRIGHQMHKIRSWK